MKNIKSVLIGLYMGIAAVGLSTSSAQAILIDNGVTTRDTDTNLDWLDLTQSINRSYNDVAGQFGVGGDYAGWRHASVAEVTTLFLNAGAASTTGGYTTTNNAAAHTIVSLLGSTFPSSRPTYDYTYGLTATDFDATRKYLAIALFCNSSLRVTTCTSINGGGHNDLGFIGATIGRLAVTDALPEVGNFLVRVSTQVPEPTTLALFAISFAGLGVARTRRKKRLDA